MPGRFHARAGRGGALRRAWVRGSAGVVLLSLLAAPSGASPETLKRSCQNILFAPFDLVLSPVVAGWTIARNQQREDDPMAVRVGFALPGFAWNTGVQVLAAALREVAGLLEFAPGLLLLGSERDLPPLYHPAERGPALLDWETPALHVRMGVDYTTIPYEKPRS